MNIWYNARHYTHIWEVTFFRLWWTALIDATHWWYFHESARLLLTLDLASILFDECFWRYYFFSESLKSLQGFKGFSTLLSPLFLNVYSMPFISPFSTLNASRGIYGNAFSMLYMFYARTPRAMPKLLSASTQALADARKHKDAYTAANLKGDYIQHFSPLSQSPVIADFTSSHNSQMMLMLSYSH